MIFEVADMKFVLSQGAHCYVPPETVYSFVNLDTESEVVLIFVIVQILEQQQLLVHGNVCE